MQVATLLQQLLLLLTVACATGEAVLIDLDQVLTRNRTDEAISLSGVVDAAGGNETALVFGALDVREDAAPEVPNATFAVQSAKAVDDSSMRFSSIEDFLLTAPPRTAPRLAQPETSAQESGCESFESNPRDPGSNVQEVFQPWNTRPYTCKLFVEFSNGARGLCSGSLVGPFMLATARHCTYSACLGPATQVRAACGYGYVANALDGYDHFGTALFTGTCLRYSSYDDGVSCVNGEDVVSDSARDIQICELDREIGRRLGWFGMTSADISSVNVEGYPGNTDLNQFISSATDKKLHRFESVSTTTSTRYFVDNMWAWGGETGGPYYRYNGDTDERHVGAVHRGGPTGCREDGTRATSDLIEALKAVRGEPSSSSLAPWTAKGSYCHLFPYHADIWGLYPGESIYGVGRTSPAFSSTSQFVGSTFVARVSLYNVGSDPATYTLKWYASTNSVISELDTLLAERAVTISGNTVTRYTYTLPTNFVGDQFIGALWQSATDCFLNDGVYVVVGQVEGVVPPTDSPTEPPTPRPTGSPTPGPTESPTRSSAEPPSPSPAEPPSPGPAGSPTPGPTGSPTPGPTESPTRSSAEPPTSGSGTPSPTRAPTSEPTASAQEDVQSAGNAGSGGSGVSLRH